MAEDLLKLLPRPHLPSCPAGTVADHIPVNQVEYGSNAGGGTAIRGVCNIKQTSSTTATVSREFRANMASLLFDRVDKTYPNGHPAVRGLTLEIREGEFLVLVGPSGCGKTTALRLVAGLERPTNGRIFLGGRDVTDLPPAQRDVALVFQNFALYPHRTVRDNLAFGLRMRGTSEPLIAERVAAAAQTLGLSDVLDRRPSQLSGGQRQRVALGRALVRRPQAFLLDEPLSNLDTRLRVEMRAELTRLHRHLGATLLYVTHDHEEALTLGDRVGVLRDGVLQQLAPPLEIYHRPVNAFTAGFLGSPAMNFFRCRTRATERGTLLESTAFRILLERPFASPLPGELLLGVRPQDVHRVEPDDADAVARIDVIQTLGRDQVLYLKLPAVGTEPSLTLLAPADWAVRENDTINIRFNRDRLHLFDVEQENRLN